MWWQDHSICGKSVFHGVCRRRRERAASLRPSALPGEEQAADNWDVQRGQPSLQHNYDCETRTSKTHLYIVDFLLCLSLFTVKIWPL